MFKEQSIAISGLSGVQEKHYDMWEYMPQKLHALMIWEKFLRALLENGE